MKRKPFYPHIVLLALVCLASQGFTMRPQGLVQVETALMQGNYSQAHDFALDFIADSPDKLSVYEARYYLGVSLMRLKEYQKARDVFTSLQKNLLVPRLEEKITLGIFDAFYLQENYQQAYRVIKALLAKRPDSDYLSLIYLKAGRVSMKRALWDEAKQYLGRITTRYPYSLESFSAKQLLEEEHFFAVQVGSFSDAVLADKLVNELKRKGKYAYIVETELKDGTTFYRVRVGQMASLKSAQELKSQLAGEGYPTSIYP
jgi:tetratricopeptide (TPR) repeat protein